MVSGIDQPFWACRSITCVGLSTPAHASALDELLAWKGRSGRGFVLDSFWSAWDAFAQSSSYRETIQNAVGYGNDTDTTAAIAGGLAGIYWGTAEEADGIPTEWLAVLRGKELVEAIAGPIRRSTKLGSEPKQRRPTQPPDSS